MLIIQDDGCNGQSLVESGKLFLHVFDWPQDGVLRLPNLHCRAIHTYSMLTPEVPLSVSETAHGWQIALPEQPSGSPATVFVLEHEGEVSADRPLVLLPGHINTWPSTWAGVEGQTQLAKFTWDVKKGSWHHANCLHNWASPSDKAVWHFDVHFAGEYFLDLTYSADTDAGNREGWFQIDAGQETPFIAYSTAEGGHVGGVGATPRLRFETIRVGMVRIQAPGQHTLTIRPDGEGTSWIKLRSVTLGPVI